MSKLLSVYVITLLTAFCSIVYELLLSQSLSAFFGDTVLRYSTTIGLYLLSMGVGSRLAEGPVRRRAGDSLLWIELLLALVGGSLVMLLYQIDLMSPSPLVFNLAALTLVVLVGGLTGLELPLLLALSEEPREKTGIVFAFNYFGAFLGSVAFAFMFFPEIGLPRTALFTGALNACCGIWLYFLVRGIRFRLSAALAAQVALFAAFCALLIYSGKINLYFHTAYLTKQ